MANPTGINQYTKGGGNAVSTYAKGKQRARKAQLKSYEKLLSSSAVSVRDKRMIQKRHTGLLLRKK